MRLGKPRGGGGTVSTTIALELHALKESGRFPWLSSGCLYHCIVLNEGGACPGITPGTPLHSDADKRLIFVITSHSRGLHSTGYFDST